MSSEWRVANGEWRVAAKSILLDEGNCAKWTYFKINDDSRHFI